MIKFKHTNITLREVGGLLRVKLQDELKAQKHNATGRLSRGLKYNVIKRGMSVLNITSSVDYWKAVNNPKFAKKPNFSAIVKWVRAKGLQMSSAEPIFKKLRTNFAGYVANKYKKEVASKLAPSIGVDVANMIADQIKKNNPKTNVQRAF